MPIIGTEIMKTTDEREKCDTEMTITKDKDADN